jgi:helicase SWR1
MEEQVNTLPLEVLLGIPSSLRIVKEEIGGEDVEMEQVEEKRSTREVRGGGGKSRVEERMEVIEELPPPPRAKTREPSKRKPTPITVESATPTPTMASFTISPVQSRRSKKRRIATPSDVADEFQMNLDVSHRPTVDSPASLVEKGRTTRSKPPPVQVYNLPPVPPPRYTCPEQFPAHRPPAVPAAHVIFASPKLTAFPASRDAASVFPTEVLKSFVMLEADGDLLTKEDLRRMAEAQVEVVRRVIELQVRGRRILPGHTEDGNGPAPRHHAPRTRHDATVEHALRFRTYMLREQKYRISQKKKIVKAVDGYWSGIASVEERRRKEEERRIRTGAREIAKLIKSKWKLAIKVSFHIAFPD